MAASNVSYVVAVDGEMTSFDNESDAQAAFAEATFENTLELSRMRSVVIERLSRGIVVEKKRRKPRDPNAPKKPRKPRMPKATKSK